MRRVLLAAVVLLLGGALLPLGFGEARKKSKSQLKFRTARGPQIAIPPQTVTQVGQYDLRCPGRYVATGYGVGLGATDLVYAEPSVSGRGYDFSFANPSTTSTFHASGQVRCARGRKLRVKAQTSRSEQRLAVREARAALRRR
jgi:hypothetical protein